MKKIISVSLVLVILLFLAACGSSKLTSGDLIGTWSGSWEFNGNNINSSIEFQRDGTLVKVSYINNEMSKLETETYIIDGNKVVINWDNPPSTTTYKFKDGRLTDSPVIYSKES